MSELYPLKFKPIYKEKVWGGERLKKRLKKTDAPVFAGESWEISGEKGSVSIVSNGFLAGNELDELIEVYMGDLVGDRVFNEFGIHFPLLFKFIDANDVLSVQVHPDDELAQKLKQPNGKTEIWYIIHAESGAYVYTGFNQPMTREKLQQNIQNKTVKQVLNKEEANAGDVFYVPAGRIHATGPGVLLAEIQQSSDITYRVYDWNRKWKNGKPRELHIEKALETLDFNKQTNVKTKYPIQINESNKIQTSPYFTLNKIILNEDKYFDYNQIDSFVVYMCVKGKVELQYNKDKSEFLEIGQTVLIPAVLESLKLIPHNEVELLEIYI